MEGRQMSNLQILLLILAFVVLSFGSFIWFVATWDADREESLSRLQPGLNTDDPFERAML